MESKPFLVFWFPRAGVGTDLGRAGVPCGLAGMTLARRECVPTPARGNEDEPWSPNLQIWKLALLNKMSNVKLFDCTNGDSLKQSETIYHLIKLDTFFVRQKIF